MTNFFIILSLIFIFTKFTNSETEKTLPLTPEEIVRLEFEQFEKEVEDFKKELRREEEDTIQDQKRKKRTVIFNVWTPVDLGLIIGIPITVILPTLTNFFNWKWKRSADEIDLDENQGFEEDPIVQPHLDKISSYFELIKIPEKSCQQRAVCEFSAEPDKFYPISELVLDRIRNPSLPVLAILEEDNNNLMATNETNYGSGKSLFKLYAEAADKGLSYGIPMCAQEFSSRCPHSIEKRLNMPVLQFWNLLSSTLKFSMRDDINFT